MNSPMESRDSGLMLARRMRIGFTLIELLVVITIIGMLMSLLLPAVMNARESARRIQCSNNLHNLGLAMHSEVSVKGRFPASGNFEIFGREFYHSWVVPLLAHLERSDIASEWNWNKPYNTPPNSKYTSISISVLVCPDDFTVVSGQGNLSYVVNGGFGYTAGSPTLDCPTSIHGGSDGSVAPVDFNGNGIACPTSGPEESEDKKLYFDTGLFFIENWPKGKGTKRHHTMDSIFDGTSNTLMLSENIRAGYDPTQAAYWSTWASPWPASNSFFLSSYVCENRTCAAGNVNYQFANDRSGDPYRLEAINSSVDQAEGDAPWPSSQHPGGVNVAFCDGHVQFLSDELDGAVYAALVSPRGAKIHGPLAQVILSSDDY